MINFILVGNGTTAFNFHYRPWLPFYDFGLYLIGLVTLTIILVWANQDKIAVFTVDLLGSSILGAYLNWILSLFLNLTPLEVFLTWLSFTFVILVYLGPYSQIKLLMQRGKENEA